MKYFLTILLLLSVSFVFSQRGKTGDTTFKHRFPNDVFNTVSDASLTLINEVDHDIIVVIRDQEKKYLRHVYIRNLEKFTFDKLPITRLYVQFKSKEFYFEDLERTPINYGDKHIFNFFFDPRQESNYYEITEEEFFKP